MTLRRFFGLVLLVVSFNYLFVSDSANATTVGWIWLAIAVLALWDDVMRLVRSLGIK